MFDIYYFILIVPALIFAMYCQYKVKSAFETYSHVPNRKGMTGAMAARSILDQSGLGNVLIELVHGNLTDHYDPKKNVIRLSEAVYSSNSVAAVGIAAHEAGHAVQHRDGYVLIKLRNAIVPVASIGTYIAFPLIIIGFLFEMFRFLVPVGIILFATIFLFQLVTLPVEFNASNRAIKILRTDGILEEDELVGVNNVLSAAAMTYVAATITALAQLLRLIAIFGRRNGR